MMMLSFLGLFPDHSKKKSAKPTANPSTSVPSKNQGAFYAPFGSQYSAKVQPLAKTGMPKTEADSYVRRALGATGGVATGVALAGTVSPSGWPKSRYSPNDNNGKKHNGYKAFFIDGFLMAPIRQLLSPQGLLMAGVGIALTALTGPGILPFFAVAGLGASGYEFFKGFKQYGKAKNAKQRAEALKLLGASLSDGVGALLGMKSTAMAAKLPGVETVNGFKEPGRFLKTSFHDLGTMLHPEGMRHAWGQMAQHTAQHQHKLQGLLQHITQWSKGTGEHLQQVTGKLKGLPQTFCPKNMHAPDLVTDVLASSTMGEKPLAIRLSDLPKAAKETLDPLQGQAQGWLKQIQTHVSGWGQTIQQRFGLGNSTSASATTLPNATSINQPTASVSGIHAVKQDLSTLDGWETLGLRRHSVPLEPSLPKGLGKLDAFKTFAQHEDWHVSRGITVNSTQGSPWGHPSPPTYLKDQLKTLTHIIGGTPQEMTAWGRMGMKEVKALRVNRPDYVRGFWKLATHADEVKPQLSSLHGDYLVKVHIEKGAYALPETLIGHSGSQKRVWMPEQTSLVVTHVDDTKKLVQLTMKAPSREQRLKHSVQHYMDHQALYRNHYRHLATEQPEVWQQLNRQAHGHMLHDLVTHAQQLGGHGTGTKTYYAGIPAGVDPTKLQAGKLYHEVIPLTLYREEASALGSVGQKSGMLLKLNIAEKTPVITRRQLAALGIHQGTGDGLLLPSSALKLEALSHQGKMSQWQVAPMRQTGTQSLSLPGTPLPVDIALAEMEGPWFPMLSGMMGHPHATVKRLWQTHGRDPFNRTIGSTYRWGQEAFVRPLERVGAGQGQWGWDLSRLTFELGAVTGVARGALDVVRHQGTGMYSTSVHRILGQGVTQSLTMGTLGTGGGMLGSYTGASVARTLGWGKSHAWNEQAVQLGQTLGGVIGGTTGTLLGAQAARLPIIQALGNLAVSTVLWVPTTLVRGTLGVLGLGGLGVAGTGLGLAKGAGSAFKWALN
ncbi:MAG: hypothetical protein ACKO37_09700 [Vampirovibrionales bacterium]